MLTKKMLVALVALAVSLGSAGFATAGRGSGGSSMGGGGLSQGHGVMNRSMSDASHDNVASRNQTQLRARKEIGTQGTGTSDQSQAQRTRAENSDGSGVLHESTDSPTSLND
jgi:hypothetical protein